MSSIAFTRGKVLLASGRCSWSDDGARSFGVLLASESYQPRSSDRTVADVTGELTGVGYARKTLTGLRVDSDEDADVAACFADSVTWRSLSTRESYRWAVIYRVGKDDSSSDLIVALDLGGVSLAGLASHTVLWGGTSGSGMVFTLS